MMHEQHATLAMATSILLSSSEALGDDVTGRVLDVGCGNKPYKRLFPDCEWVGLDIRPVGDVEGDAHEMRAFDDESFDTVLCTEMLHLSLSPLLCMREMARVVKKGGKVVVTVPNTHMEDGQALWGIKVQGLDYLMQGALLKPQKLMAEGRVFLQEWNSNIGYDKFGFEAPEISGFIESLDKRYPAITAAVGLKE